MKPGYDAIRYTVRIAGNGSKEDCEAIHESVLRTSPNCFNLAQRSGSTEPPTTYTVNNVNQYSTLVEDTVPRSLSYDNNGNLVAPPSGNAYTFDAENRLVSATTPSRVLPLSIPVCP